MPRKPTADRLDALEALVTQQSELVNALLAKLSTLPQDAPAAPQAPAPARVSASAPGGPPSGFMAYVNAQRGLRVEPLPDDPEAPALEAAAEKLAAMHPIDRQAFLENLRHVGRRNDLRKERETLGFTGESDADLDELLGSSDE